ncbi:MAG: hypothetical protein CM1200mP30_30920 [Pseudomonadota bacterium]|nr:MAG: hypothetical protein CM1200mP30_30920 [Pseudomonadota bacterium]
MSEKLSTALKDQMDNGETTFVEVVLNQELGEPFRRDAMKAPVPVAGINRERHAFTVVLVKIFFKSI